MNRASAYSAYRMSNAQRFNSGINGSRRIGTATAGAALAHRNGNWTRNGNWSAGNWHHRHHHHRNFVFVGGFYPYSWYDPWYYPYDYGYSSYAQPMVYDGYAAGAYDGSLVSEVQTRLASAGYYRGRIDGVMGPETRRAIRAYERARGLRVDGIIDEQLLSTMGVR